MAGPNHTPKDGPDPRWPVPKDDPPGAVCRLCGTASKRLARVHQLEKELLHSQDEHRVTAGWGKGAVAELARLKKELAEAKANSCVTHEAPYGPPSEPVAVLCEAAALRVDYLKARIEKAETKLALADKDIKRRTEERQAAMRRTEEVEKELAAVKKEVPCPACAWEQWRCGPLCDCKGTGNKYPEE